MCAEQGLEVYSLAAEEYTDKRQEDENEAAQRYLAVLFFDGLSNIKFNALKTDISNQALQGEIFVPRTYDQVLKLAGAWENKSAITHNNTRDARD